MPITSADAKHIRTLPQSPGREFLLRMSYMEIYNETVHDLLEAGNLSLKIREDKQVRTYAFLYFL